MALCPCQFVDGGRCKLNPTKYPITATEFDRHITAHHQESTGRSTLDLDTFGLGTSTLGSYPELVYSTPAATQGSHWAAIAGLCLLDGPVSPGVT